MGYLQLFEVKAIHKCVVSYPWKFIMLKVSTTKRIIIESTKYVNCLAIQHTQSYTPWTCPHKYQLWNTVSPQLFIQNHSGKFLFPFKLQISGTKYSTYIWVTKKKLRLSSEKSSISLLLKSLKINKPYVNEMQKSWF